MRSLFATTWWACKARPMGPFHALCAQTKAAPKRRTKACAFGATVQQSFPSASIDGMNSRALTHAPDAVETYENMRDEYSRRRLLGIDRLDY